MPALVLGPLLRHVGIDDATVWVETDGSCEVEILGRRERTFHVAGHHYALVVVDGLAPGTEHPYTVTLDGEQCWPEPDSPFPPSLIRTFRPGERLTLAFGSCRVAVPHEYPFSLDRGSHAHGRGADALAGLVARMRGQSPHEWPDALLLLGDQVYADDVPPRTLAFIRARRPVEGPHGEEAADFEEYTQLYRESWSEPAIRWLLSTAPSAMIFDDHDVHDDWNISASWKREMQAQPWWEERIVAALASYWLYQHLGNLSLTELGEDDLYARVRAAGDGWPALREFARQADRETAGSRWSYRRDLGRTRLVVLDSRAGRVLDDRREILDEAEWQWVDEQLTGDVDHLLVATSLPFLLPPAAHHVEAWNEAVCDGAWGVRAARLGEWVRRAADLEHWAAFRSSFARLSRLLRAVAAGERGAPPATTLLLSGDIHCSYLAAADAGGDHAPLYQIVCSPLRNEVPPQVARAQRLAWRPLLTRVTRRLARMARVPDPPLRWYLNEGPCVRNAVATLTFDGPRARLALEGAGADASGRPRLTEIFSAELAAEARRAPDGSE